MGIFAGYALSFLIFATPDVSKLMMKDVSGHSISTEGWKNKVVVLDFWATWCASCREGLPSFVELSKSPEWKDIQFYAVSIDSSLDPVKDYIQENKIPASLVAHSAAELNTLEQFKLVSIPATIILNRGQLAYKDDKPLKFSLPDLKKEMKKALGK